MTTYYISIPIPSIYCLNSKKIIDKKLFISDIYVGKLKSFNTSLSSEQNVMAIFSINSKDIYIRLLLLKHYKKLLVEPNGDILTLLFYKDNTSSIFALTFNKLLSITKKYIKFNMNGVDQSILKSLKSYCDNNTPYVYSEKRNKEDIINDKEKYLIGIINGIEYLPENSISVGIYHYENLEINKIDQINVIMSIDGTKITEMYAIACDIKHIKPIHTQFFDLYQTKKRKDYISWDELFMGIAALSAQRSKDPVTQVGSCIVKDNKVLSIGYNGFPNNCSDDNFPWSKNKENLLEDKRTYVVHSELNAILNSKENLDEATLYVTMFPCNECAKAIIQSGIKKIIYLKYENKPVYEASKIMFDSAGVEYVEFTSDIKNITLDL